MDQDLLSFFQQARDWVTDNRPLRLRMSHPTKMLEDVLLPQRVEGSESICGGIEYRILCVSLDACIPLKELIALPVAVDIVTDRGDLRSICGIVTEARAGDSDGGLASYLLVLRDALSILEKRSNTRVFRNKNEVEIVRLILDEWRHTNAIIGACFNLEMDGLFARNTYPKREFTMQYNEPDASFIRRLLKRRGIAWYFRADGEKFPAHTMVLFNHPASLQENKAGIVRYHRDAATEERDTITSWCAVRTLQPASVTRFSWNYKKPQAFDFMFVTAQGRADQGESGNCLAASLDDYQVLPPHAGDNHDDLCALGLLAMKRHDFESKCFYGEGSVRDMCAGEYFALEGHPEIRRSAGSKCEFVLTSVRLAVVNNLSKELAERVQRLFSRNDWTTGEDADVANARTRVKVSFVAVELDTPIVPAYDASVETPNVPMQSAIVVGPEGEEVYCDELGRVKVRFLPTRAADHEHAQGAGASDTGSDSAWLRVASNWAGNGPWVVNQCGSLHLPRVGSEVLVAFLGGDPDKPIIVGQLYNVSGVPPAFNLGGSLPGNRYLSGLKSREVHSGRANALRFDDTTGEISAQIRSDHGDSQLNLGFLTSPRTNGQANYRGEGAELRTDESVAIRGAKGVLLSAESNPDGETLMRDGLIGVAETLAAIAKELCELNTLHSKDQATSASLEALLERVRNWSSTDNSQEGKSLLAGTSNDGIVLTTPSSTIIGSQDSLDLISARGMHLHSGQSAKMMAMKGISLFSHDEGMKLVTANGGLQVQSQNGDIDIVASGKIRICAGKGIELVAPEIKLASKGAQANFGADGIVQQCTGDFLLKSRMFEHTSGGAGLATDLAFPSTSIQTDERVYLYSAQSGMPLAGRKYRLELPDGSIIEGVTDSEGRTELAKHDAIGELKITIFPEADPETDGAMQ